MQFFRSLLIVGIVVILWIGCLPDQAEQEERRRAALVALEEQSAIVSMDDQQVVWSIYFNARTFDRDIMPSLVLFPDLRQLDLRGALILDDDLEAIGSLDRLEKLYLSDTPIGNVGIAELDALKNLGILDLSGTAVTDEGLDALVTLTALEHLDLSRTQVTENGVQQLQESLADCRIRYDQDSSDETADAS